MRYANITAKRSAKISKLQDKALKLAQTKDELAFLIGHEIAHNILHYKNFDANEANLLAIDYLDKPKIRQIKSIIVWSNEKREIEADIEGVHLAF